MKFLVVLMCCLLIVSLGVAVLCKSLNDIRMTQKVTGEKLVNYIMENDEIVKSMVRKLTWIERQILYQDQETIDSIVHDFMVKKTMHAAMGIVSIVMGVSVIIIEFLF